jgi:preprotein translocase subunit SecD
MADSGDGAARFPGRVAGDGRLARRDGGAGPCAGAEPDRRAGERRCPADTAFSIGGERFGSGDVALVEARFDESGMPVIVIDFSDQGHARFVALQEGRVGETLRICLGDTLVFEPYLAAPITDSSLQIASAATAPDTLDLARRIREQLFTGKAPKGQDGG